jgi:hypothetical protein
VEGFMIEPRFCFLLHLKSPFDSAISHNPYGFVFEFLDQIIESLVNSLLDLTLMKGLILTQIFLDSYLQPIKQILLIALKDYPYFTIQVLQYGEF